MNIIQTYFKKKLDLHWLTSKCISYRKMLLRILPWRANWKLQSPCTSCTKGPKVRVSALPNEWTLLQYEDMLNIQSYSADMTICGPTLHGSAPPCSRSYNRSRMLPQIDRFGHANGIYCSYSRLVALYLGTVYLTFVLDFLSQTAVHFYTKGTTTDYTITHTHTHTVWWL